LSFGRCLIALRVYRTVLSIRIIISFLFYLFVIHCLSYYLFTSNTWRFCPMSTQPSLSHWRRWSLLNSCHLCFPLPLRYRIAALDKAIGTCIGVNPKRSQSTTSEAASLIQDCDSSIVHDQLLQSIGLLRVAQNAQSRGTSTYEDHVDRFINGGLVAAFWC